MENIEQKIHQLPKYLQQEVIDFIEFLIKKHIQQEKEKTWVGLIGGLKENKSREIQFRLSSSEKGFGVARLMYLVDTNIIYRRSFSARKKQRYSSLFSECKFRLKQTGSV